MAEARRSDNDAAVDNDAEVMPTDALKEAGQQLLSLLAQRATQAASDRVTDLTGRLTGIADNGGTGVLSAFRGERTDDDDDRRGADDDSGDDSGGDGEERRSGIGGMFGNLKDKVAGLFGGGSGGGGGGGGKGKKLKVTVISESLDIGLPLRTTYNLWTQYEDFPSFMKKVENVDLDDEKSTWKAQVFWSHREWQATTVEQVADSHIVWTSTGAKGHVDGAVTFTSLGANLTRVLLVMEYYPQGLFERTGNIWRAQGRRARLEFQHFRRHAMTQAILNQDEIEGWRGEIRDGEVVTTHEEAMEAEQSSAAQEDDEARDDTAAASEQDGEGTRAAGEDVEDEDTDEADEEPVDEADEYAEDADDLEDAEDAEGTEPVDEYDETEDYDEPVDETDEDAEPVEEYDETEDADDTEETDETDETEEPGEDEEPEPDRDGRRRRQPVAARSGRRR